MLTKKQFDLLSELEHSPASTQRMLAKKAGMSRQNVSTVVRRGTCEPRTAGKLASALGVDIADIIEDSKGG